MRFLHLADLHLGKQLNEVSLLEDQQFILTQIADIARDERTDAVLIAGDVYQRSQPQAEAMAAFDAFITRLCEMKQQVFIISGNHDSALRISYFGGLLRRAGVYVTELYDGAPQSVSLHDRYGALTVWMLPFLRPGQVKRALPEAKIGSYQDAMRAALGHAAVDPKERNLLLCHQFVTGAQTCDSEERAVGGLDNIDAQVFDAFDYVALGHIHKPQKVGRDTLRYAGSPLKYSFSEAAHKKSVCIVDLEEKGEVRVKTVPLYPLRNMRLIEGRLDEVMRMPYSEDYVWVTLRDELVAPDASVTLRTAFPHMLKCSVLNSRTKFDLDTSGAGAVESKSIPELFSDFYRLQNNGVAPTDAHMSYLKKVLEKLEEEDA